MGVTRFLLAMVVIVFHCGLDDRGMEHSHIAVKCFFMISGFYMAMILDQKYGLESAGLKAFAVNRFLRLYPLYFVILIGTIGWYLLRLRMIGDRTPMPGILALQGQVPNWQVAGFWFSNFTLIGLDFISLWDWVPGVGYFFLHPTTLKSHPDAVNLASTIWIVQAWSVSMEILFYMTAPFLARRSLFVIAAVIIASGGLDYWITYDLNRVSYFFAPAQLYLFATGILMYRLSRFTQAIPPRATLLVSGSLFCAFWFCLFTDLITSEWIYFCLMAPQIPLLFRLSQHSRFDRFIGDLSYPLYVSHLLVAQVSLVALKMAGFPDTSLSRLLLPLFCVLAAIALHYCVERPIEIIRSSISRRIATLSFTGNRVQTC